MKKLIVIFSIVIILIQSGIAQTSTSFGLRVTPMFNWVTASDTSSLYTFSNSNTEIGIGFGPSMRYSFSDNFNVDISGIFTWQEFGIVQSEDGLNLNIIDITEDFKVQYLNIPLNLNGQFYIVGNFQAIINFGLTASIMLKSARRITDNIGLNQFSSDYEKVSVLNFADIFLTAGLGTAYSFDDNLHLSLTAQYNNGVLDGWFDRKNNAPSTIQELTLKHRNITLNIGFYIDF